MPQSLAKVYLHVVFSTKNREPLLAADWRDELFRVLGGAANNLGCQSMIVGALPITCTCCFSWGGLAIVKNDSPEARVWMIRRHFWQRKRLSANMLQKTSA